MVYASKPDVFGDGFDETISLTLPVAYLRLALCCLTSQDVIWMDGAYGSTAIDDQEQDLLDNAVSVIADALNDA